MEGTVEAKFLTEKEVDYLLSLFDIATKRKTLNTKRGILNNLFEQGSLTDREDPKFDLNRELKTIEDTLKELELSIMDFEGPTADSMYKILLSRLIVLGDRIARFKVINDPDKREDMEKQSDFKKESYATCFELYTRLKAKGKRGDRFSFSPVLNSTTQPSASAANINTVHSIPIYKWGVSFDGTSSVKAFLERVSELAVARSVSNVDLFKSSLDLFQGAALTWFRANRDSFTCWSDITEALSRDFLPPCYEESLLDQIKARCQGKTESVNIFVSTMLNLFSRLSKPPSENEKLQIIRRNLLPKYINYLVLQDISDIPELLSYCKKIDEATYFKNKYNPPSANCLETDLAYVESQAAGVSQIDQTDKQDVSQSNQNNFHRITCWNCNRQGHAYNNCRAPRKKFCFKCEKPNFVINTCPKCKPKN